MAEKRCTCGHGLSAHEKEACHVLDMDRDGQFKKIYGEWGVCKCGCARFADDRLFTFKEAGNLIDRDLPKEGE